MRMRDLTQSARARKKERESSEKSERISEDRISGNYLCYTLNINEIENKKQIAD